MWCQQIPQLAIGGGGAVPPHGVQQGRVRVSLVRDQIAQHRQHARMLAAARARRPRADAATRPASLIAVRTFKGRPATAPEGRGRQQATRSVDAVAGVELAGIGAEAADRLLPHRRRRRLEDDRGVDVGDQPRRRGELGVELAGAPAGVAGEDARARRRRLDQAAQQQRRRRQVDAVGDRRPLRSRPARCPSGSSRAAARPDRRPRAPGRRRATAAAAAAPPGWRWCRSVD